METGRKTSKAKAQDRFRIFVQAVSFAFHNGYVLGWIRRVPYSGDNKQFCLPGLNCYSCPGAIAACPIGALQSVLDSGKMKVSLYVLGFIGAVGMLCGRLVCGWLCPFGAVQDLMYRIPLFKKAKNLPGHKVLRWLKFVVLGLFVILLPMLITGPAGNGQPWFCEWICPSGTLLGGIPLLITNQSLWAAAGWRFAWKVTVLLLILVGSVKFYRPFCKYLCPLGALYGSCNKLSLYRLKVDEEKCVTCGACQKACGMDIPVWQKPNSIECIRCGKCMAACPTGAISSTWQDLLGKKKTAGSAVATAPSDGTVCAETAGTPAKVSPTAPSAANRVARVLLALAILGTGAVSIALHGTGLITKSVAGAGSDFFYFVLNFAMPIGLVSADVCCIAYACKLLWSLKRPECDADTRQLGKILALINGLVNIVAIPLIMLFFCLFAGYAFGESAEYILYRLALLAAYWLIPTVLMLISTLLLKKNANRSPGE